MDAANVIGLVGLLSITPFLILLGKDDFENRKVCNRNVLLFYIPCIALFLMRLVGGLVTLQTLILSAVWIFCCVAFWKQGIIGGADCKILFGLAVAFPESFVLLLAFMLVVCAVYSAAAKSERVDEYLKIKDGIPVVACLAIAWIPFLFIS